MVIARILLIAMFVVVPLVVAQGNTTFHPETTPSPATTLPPPTIIPSTPRSSPGSDWSLSEEQLDLVNRRIRNAEEESPVTTTLSPLDYDHEDTPEEPEEPSAVSGEHLPVGRHTQNRPGGGTASQEVLDASYPARRRRQVMIRRRRQIPLPLAPPPTRGASQNQLKTLPGSGKGQGEYHGTVLGAVFIKPKPSTGAPAQLVRRQ